MTGKKKRKIKIYWLHERGFFSLSFYSFQLLFYVCFDVYALGLIDNNKFDTFFGILLLNIRLNYLLNFIATVHCQTFTIIHTCSYSDINAQKKISMPMHHIRKENAMIISSHSKCCIYRQILIEYSIDPDQINFLYFPFFN